MKRNKPFELRKKCRSDVQLEKIVFVPVEHRPGAVGALGWQPLPLTNAHYAHGPTFGLRI